MSRNSVIAIHLSFWAIYILAGVLINVAGQHDLKVTCTSGFIITTILGLDKTRFLWKCIAGRISGSVQCMASPGL
jgi:hypothetical protein